MEPASRLRATSRANKKREIKIETGDAIPAVKLATEYLGMAVQAVASNPAFLDPSFVDEKLILGRTTYFVRSVLARGALA
jgi:hypothetical protein